MDITLIENGDAKQITFNPDEHTWKKQSGQFLPAVSSGLPGRIGTLFIKRLPKAAPAHRLLLSATSEAGRQFPHTPEIYGYARDTSHHYYFMQSMPYSYEVLEDLIAGGKDGYEIEDALNDLLVVRNIGFNIVKSASELFEVINSRIVSGDKYIYADFTPKNLMVDWNTGKCVFIDMDSCLKWSSLPKDANDTPAFQKMAKLVAVDYWSAWKLVLGVHTPEMLSVSMLLSFTVVWARATAMLRSGCDIVDVQRTILTPSWDAVQQPFWKALEANDKGAFQDYFLMSDMRAASDLFDEWKSLVLTIRNTLTEGLDANWSKILPVLGRTFGTGRRADVAEHAIDESSIDEILAKAKLRLEEAVAATKTSEPYSDPHSSVSTSSAMSLRSNINNPGIFRRFVQFAFSGKGRVNRTHFTVSIAIIAIYETVAILMSSNIFISMAIGITFWASFLSSLMLVERRFHDFGKSYDFHVGYQIIVAIISVIVCIITEDGHFKLPEIFYNMKNTIALLWVPEDNLSVVVNNFISIIVKVMVAIAQIVGIGFFIFNIELFATAFIICFIPGNKFPNKYD